MATSLLLLCAASTRSARVGGFSRADEPIDVRGASDAAGLRLPHRFGPAIHCSPWQSAMQTAAALGDAQQDAALGDRHAGRWSGLSFDQIAAADEGGLHGWIADPAAAMPGGESMADAVARIGPWLDEAAMRDAPICAVTHPMMMRAALMHMIGLLAQAAFAIDIAPLSGVMLSFNRHWRLQALGAAKGWAAAD